jgi:SSS family solute:Na+ symporter
MAPLDLIIVAVYFALVLGIGLYFAKRGKTSAEYFLAGRHVGWVAIGASLFATNISSEHFLGLAGTGSKSGLAVGHFEWLACLMVLLLGWVFTPFYLKSGVFTMPEFLERRYNSTARWYLSIVSIVAYVLTKISISLYAGTTLLKTTSGAANSITSACNGARSSGSRRSSPTWSVLWDSRQTTAPTARSAQAQPSSRKD